MLIAYTEREAHMKTTNNTLEDVTKELLVEPLLYIMEERMEDFAEDRKKYREALCALAEEQKAKNWSKRFTGRRHPWRCSPDGWG